MEQEAKRFIPEIQAQGVQLDYLIFQEQNKGNLQTVRVIYDHGISRMSLLPILDGGMSVMGSTGVGKTTLERTARATSLENGELYGLVSVPVRVVTRDLRPDDDPSEITQVSVNAFNTMVANGNLGLYWERPMQNGEIERYGRLKPDEGTIPVFFVNNAYVTNSASVMPQSVLSTAVSIIVWAPRHLRKKRFENRSGSETVKQEEVEFRMAEHGLAAYSGAHLIIKNFDREKAEADIVTLMKLLVRIKNS